MASQDSSPLQPEILAAAYELWSQSADQHSVLIRGGSMQPTILDGDRLVVTRLARLPTSGDIIVFQQDGELIAHRMLHVQKTASSAPVWLTAGDHFLQLDPPPGTGPILGVVVAIQRGGKERRLEGKWWDFSKRLVALAARAGIFINRATERIAQDFLHRPSMWLTSNGLALFIKIVQPAHWNSIE